jgi:D-arabinonate dehydratase
MKMTHVEVQRYAWPRPRPIRNGKYTYTTVALNLIHLHTDAGITGIGWGGGTAAGRPGEITLAFLEHFKPTLIGEDPFCYRRLWDSMWQPKLVGRRGIATQVISGIDIALWDLMGKALNTPVAKLLGGYTTRIPAYIVGGYYEEGKGLKELAREMEDNLTLGAKAVSSPPFHRG